MAFCAIPLCTSPAPGSRYNRSQNLHFRKVPQCRGKSPPKRTRSRSAKRSALYGSLKSYASYFRPLLDAELEAEAAAHYQSRGFSPCILHHATVSFHKLIFSSTVFVLRGTLRSSARLSRGDLLEISLDHSSASPFIEASVLYWSQDSIGVTVPRYSDSAHALHLHSQSKATVSARAAGSAVAYERATQALSLLTKPSTTVSPLLRLLAGSHSSSISAGHSSSSLYPGIISQYHYPHNRSEWEELAIARASPERSLSRKAMSISDNRQLNGSQKHALGAALSRTLSLIQGPPGTGKTLVAAEIAVRAIAEGRGPLLMVAPSNVAADNLLEKTIAICGRRKVNIVRIGRVAAVHPDLWQYTLEATLERNALIRKLRIEAECEDNGKKQALVQGERYAILKIMRNADIVVATCVGAGRDFIMADDEEGKRPEFPLLIVDEAAQATEPEVLIGVMAAGGHSLRQLVLVGDHCQLPPTVLSRGDGSNDDGLRKSLFLRLREAGVAVCLLDRQYRMYPRIAEFPSTQFYHGKVHSAVEKRDRMLPKGLKGTIFDEMDSHVLFIDVPHGAEERGQESSPDANEIFADQGISISNILEAELVCGIVKTLAGYNDNRSRTQCIKTYFSPSEIGVVSFYARQVRLLREILGRNAYPDLRETEILTVDGFQGREKEAIVLSCVRCNIERHVGFLGDWRRLNVAITRARRLLVVVGCAKTLSTDRNWAAWLAWARRAKCFVTENSIQNSISEDRGSHFKQVTP